MTRKLFESWATTVCFPIIDQRRRDLGFQGKALFFMDGLGFHHAEQFLVECAARNIGVLFLTAHASHQLQPLDFLTFAIIKQTFSVSKFDRLVNPSQIKWFFCSVRGSQPVLLTTMSKPSCLWG
jgi:hypothetical protein